MGILMDINTGNMVTKIFGDIHTSWIVLIVLVLTTILAYVFSYISGWLIRRAMRRHDTDFTRFHFLRHAITALIYVIGIAIAFSHIPSLKIIGNSLLAGAGILSIIVGLAAQESIGNLFSGIMIVIFKPFEINDQVKIKDVSGVVEDINLRQVVIRNSENNRIILPNTLVNSEMIINSRMTDPKVCKLVEVNVSLDSDIDRALGILHDLTQSHPYHIDNRTQKEKHQNVPEVKTAVVNFSDSGITLRVWAWAADADKAFDMKCDLLKSIKERFDQEGIKIATFGNLSSIIRNSGA